MDRTGFVAVGGVCMVTLPRPQMDASDTHSGERVCLGLKGNPHAFPLSKSSEPVHSK